MMRQFLGCLLVNLIVIGSLTADTDVAVRKDAVGDPLPRAALARIGSVRLLQGGTVTGMAFRRDGKVLYTIGDRSPLRAWDTTTGRELIPPGGPAATASAMAQSQDGKVLAVAISTGVRVIDLDSEKTRVVPLGDTSCQGLTFSPDGRLLVWIDAEYRSHVYDLEAAKERRVLLSRSPRKEMTEQAVPDDVGGETALRFPAPVFSADGKYLASLVQDGQVMLWDVASGKRLRSYQVDSEQAPGGILHLSFSRDGKSLHVITQMGSTRVWETDSLEEKEGIEGNNEPISAATLSQDGKRRGVCSFEGKVAVQDTGSGREVASIQIDEGGTALAFSSDGKLLATGNSAGIVRLWEVASGKEVIETGVRPRFLAVSPIDNGKKLLAVGETGIAEWTLPGGRPGKEVAFMEGKALQAVLSPDGKYVVIQTEEGQTRLVDTSNGQVREGAREQLPFGTLLAAFSPRSDILALYDGNDPRTIKLIDPVTGKERRALKREGTPPTSAALAISADGRLLLGAHTSPTLLTCYELSTGRTRQPIRIGQSFGITEGMRFPGGGGGGPRIPPPPPPGVMPNPVPDDMVHGARIVGFAPDNRQVAVARGPRIVLMQMATGKVVRTFEGADGDVSGLTFSPNGRWLTAMGQDCIVRLWDLQTGELRASLEGHRGAINATRFTSDSMRLVTAGSEGIVMVWDVNEAVKRSPAIRSVARRELRPFEEVWTELASEDAILAERAVAQLAEQLTGYLESLAKELRPVAKLQAGVRERLIAELDSNEASVRDTATRKLEEMDELAAPALLAAQKNPSAEVRRRVKRLLDRLERTQLNGKEARAIRAVEALEQAGNESARKVLQQLAAGEPEARLTREAAAALARLKLKD